MKWIERAEESVIGISLLVVTLSLFINVVLRYIFNSSSTWIEEFIRYVMVWITFIGASVCFRKGIHMGIDLILSFTSKRMSRFVHLFVTVTSIIFMGFLVKYGFDLFLFSVQTGQITPAMQIPLSWVYLAIPVGSFLSIIHLIRILIRLLSNQDFPSPSNTPS